MDFIARHGRFISFTVFLLLWLPFHQSDVPFAAAWVGNYKLNSIIRRQQPREHRKDMSRALPVPSSHGGLGASVSKISDQLGDKSYLTTLLNSNGYSGRIQRLSLDALPVLAETYQHGQWELCLVTGFQPSSKNDEWTTPRIKVQLASNTTTQDERVVDVGQLTTIWDNMSPITQQHQLSLLNSWQNRVEREVNKFPVQHGERAMQRLYQSRVGLPRKSSSKTGLTKKQINKLVDGTPNCESRRQLTESVLRKVVKAGVGFSRLADSGSSMDYLYNDYPTNEKDLLLRRMVGAYVLSRDAELGGRFKRMPCTFVSAQLCDQNNTVESITLVNGGWLAVDRSVRAGTEARKFVHRSESNNVSRVDANDTRVQLITVADERIAQRLECLAMGQLFSWNSNAGGKGDDWEQNLEIDVRETLKAMKLPTTPEGAQQALLKIGRWSQKPDAVRLEPWSQSTLDAARWFADMDKKRRRFLCDSIETARSTESKCGNAENRTDLTFLPCVCVDAKRTSFRDDAIGVRPRSITGRKVIPDASKYEILVHIADVSDIYAPSPQQTDNGKAFRLLREAAEKRGTSRYDLPLGPLHLMPPIALNALSLDTINIDMTGAEVGDGENVGANRCVTMWAYIDERSGKIIDAGFERSLVSNPLALSFADASELLEGNVSNRRRLLDQDGTLRKVKAILAVVERNLLLWSADRRRNDEAARKREARFAVKELVAKEMKGGRNIRDDGRDGFQRTRGHKIVDAALELYGHGVISLLRRAGAPLPSSGASRGARVATAPLRRYIDGVAQRQTLSVLCRYGGRPLTRNECKQARSIADRADKAVSNIRAIKQGSSIVGINQGRQQQALRLLQAELAGRNRPIPAISTGRENEVAIVGVGAVAKCRGVKGSLSPGKQILVNVRKLDAQKGILSVTLARDS